MTDTDEVLVFLERAKARTEGGAADPSTGTDAVRYARDRLSEALPHVHGGAELPADARLKPVKQAVLEAMRPITSHQAPFNRALLQAVDGTAAAIEGLTHAVDRSEQHAHRLQAGVATTELAVDDLVEEVATLRSQVADLADQVAALRALLPDA
jgi:septal ring factor EnvC (AmiA/AmiB activator)